MSKDENIGAGNVMLAFLLGATVLALLYAPAAGTETRRYLGEKARQGKDVATDAIEKGVDAFNQAHGREQA
jgi:gas vesicle protein